MSSYLANHIIRLRTAMKKLFEKKIFGKPFENDGPSKLSTFELILSDEVSG